MKLILSIIFFNFFYIAMSKDTSSCNKLWETTNSINNIPLYSMKIYACVETPYNKNEGITAPIVHDHIKNHTNGLFKNIPVLNFTNSSGLNVTNNETFIYLSNSTKNKEFQKIKNMTKNMTNTNFSQPFQFNNRTNLLAPSPSSFTITTPTPSDTSTTTPSPSDPSTTTPSPPDPSTTTPSPPDPSTTTPSPPDPSTTTLILSKNETINLNNKISNNSNTGDESLQKTVTSTESPLIYITVILSIIVSIVFIYGMYKGIRYCIEKKKCRNILRKTNPETAVNKDAANKNVTNTKDYHNKELISHQLDDMEKAKLRDIERKKSMGIYKKKTEYTKGARWKKSVKKVRKVNAIKRSLTMNNVPTNRHVRQTVREDLIRQSKAMPNGENNHTIKKLIKRLDDADREEKIEEGKTRPQTPPPPSINPEGKAQPTRKHPKVPPGMGHD